MNFNLYTRTIYLSVMGSRAYGTNNEDSDWDYRGVAIAPMECYVGSLYKFDQIVDSDKGKHVYKHFPKGLLVDSNLDHPDMQIMELSKFAGLAAQCNPSIIEILFSDKSNFVINHTVMNKLLDVRDCFLSKAAKARFCGYALSQLNRIKLHRRWILNPITVKPERKDFGLPERLLIEKDQLGAAEALINRNINEFIEQHQDFIDQDLNIEIKNFLNRSMKNIWNAINTDISYPIGKNKNFISTDDALFYEEGKNIGLSDNFLAVLNAEKRYKSAVKDYEAYQNWLKTRNPKRAELEKKYGFDCKHAMQLVRLLRMAREILETGKVNVLREDAEELKEIRNGKWSFEKIVEFANNEDLELNDVMKSSKLPTKPDVNKIHELVCNMIFEFNFNSPDDKVINNVKATILNP